MCGHCAVCAEEEDVVLVDLEQQYWPYLWWPTWGPLAIWVHVILTLENTSSTSSGACAVLYHTVLCCAILAAPQGCAVKACGSEAL